MSKSEEEGRRRHPGWARPLGRTRAEEPESGKEPPGPVFESPPPDHPLLLTLHALWISATDETIGGVVREVREIAAGAPELDPWVQTYLDTIGRLETWLRDR